MLRKTFKKLIAISASVVMLSTSFTVTTIAADVLYDKVTQEIVTKGVTYEMNQRYTTDGWQDVHVLKVDMAANNIKLAPAESQKEIGMKETVINLLNANGAIAGVNADFFGMQGNYSASFGLTVDEGNLMSVGTDKNLTSPEHATFFVDKEGNPFIDFFKVEARFQTTNENFELASVNKITAMEYPIYFDKNGGENTAQIDARFSGLVKLVIENNTITYISQKGETVNVPENGYLIILSSKYYDDMSQNLNVGQGAYTEFNTSLDLNNIQTAISGAGKIVSNGEIVKEGLIISGRQPRTAIGITEDKKTVIIVVVDGRGKSIGATHDELGWLLKYYGAFEAMHFDGGGSSTMVAKTIEDTQTEVKNTVSDGAQRRVMNALGIFDNSPIGPASQIIAKPSIERAFIGNDIGLDIKVYDDYYHKLDVPLENISVSVPEGKATVSGTSIQPLAEGSIPVTVSYGDITHTVNVEGMTPSTISPMSSSIAADIGQGIPLSVSGVSTNGYSAPISKGVTYELSDASLGSIENTVFTATKQGAGYIKCSLNGTDAYIKVSVGGTDAAVTSFEDKPTLSFSKFPAESISGFAAISEGFVQDGAVSLLLNYTMANSTSTQAAYMNFASPIQLSGSPSSLTMSVYGNNSGHWVRGKIKDAGGAEHIIDFTKNINWNGWADTTAQIPAEVKYPISLESVYVAALSNTNTNATQICIDNLRTTLPFEVTNVPADTKVNDSLYGNALKADDGAYYVSVSGTVASSNADSAIYDSERMKIHTVLQSSSTLAIYGGNNDIVWDNTVDTIKWDSNGYRFDDKGNLAVIQLTAAKGGLKNTIATQWQNFKTDAIRSSSKNILFIMDRSPLNFTDATEKELFFDALAGIKAAGKNIFVVSTANSTQSVRVKDGVRFVNLPSLWNSDGSVNQNFRLLRLRITEDSIHYEITGL